MSGTIRKDQQRGTWYFVVDVSPPGSPKREQVRKRGFATKKEADAALTELLAERNRGTYVRPTKQTVADFVTEWLGTIRRTVRPSTWSSYERNLRVHVVPRIGHYPLQAVDAGVIGRLYSDLLADGHRGAVGHAPRASERPAPPKAPVGLSPRTVNYVGTILHRVFREAVEWKRVPINPVSAVKRPKVPTASATVKAWDASTLRTFLEQSRTYEGKGGRPDRYYALWVLLATTGMRRGEALGLRWADVDLDACTASVAQTVIAVDHQVQLGTPKTSAGARLVDLDTDTVAALRRHRSEQNQERLLMGEGFTDHGLVFCLPDGRPYHPERVSTEFDRRVAKFGLPRLTLHGLRHTWATLALRTGEHPKVVQERLGHSTIGITLGTYSHVSAGMQAEAAERVARAIFG